MAIAWTGRKDNAVTSRSNTPHQQIKEERRICGSLFSSRDLWGSCPLMILLPWLTRSSGALNGAERREGLKYPPLHLLPQRFDALDYLDVTRKSWLLSGII